MNTPRRDFLKLAGAGIPAAAVYAAAAPGSSNHVAAIPAGHIFDIRLYGAKGDGIAIDTIAINKAIEDASANGGGTVHFPAGVYASYSIHLRSNVTLYLEAGATILAASTPDEGMATGGYDAAEPNQWDTTQDFGHSHWHNSLMWGEDLHDVAILGPGLIWGKGLTRAYPDELPHPESSGVGNKAIALKNCRNVLLRDFSMLQGGHFAILVTGVDNLCIDNVKIDTNRDGMDIDCCRNVRISNCTVNAPWDDGICPKSSLALGYPRATENITITNCYITGAYQLGSVLDGTWKPFPAGIYIPRTGRIKFGTESNGGFKNVTISNCVLDGCRGIALETADGAQIEDVTITGITMRDCTNTPIFLRICRRMRGAKDKPVGTLRRVILSNIVSYNCVSDFACEIMGIPGYKVEDIKFSDMYLHHKGGGTTETAKIIPPEMETKYPDPRFFGPLPAHGFFVRHAQNLEFSNIEIAYEKPDARPAFWLNDVNGADFFRIKQPKAAIAPLFSLNQVQDFKVFASRGVKDTESAQIDTQTL